MSKRITRNSKRQVLDLAEDSSSSSDFTGGSKPGLSKPLKAKGRRLAEPPKLENVVKAGRPKKGEGKKVTKSIGSESKSTVTAGGTSTSSTESLTISPGEHNCHSVGGDTSKNLMEIQTARQASPLLKHFLKVYSKQMKYDLWLFGATAAFIHSREGVGGEIKALYPGSDKHITPALFFNSVIFVDFNAKMADYYKDKAMLDWLSVNKRFDGGEEPSVRFLTKNYTAGLGIPFGTMDLFISQSAGNVSTPCKKYLRPGGYALVGDSHGDAKICSADPEFELIGYFDGTVKIVTDPTAVDHCFRDHKTGLKLSGDQARKALDQPRGKWGFKMLQEWMWYLFQKR